jgi:hypothetical protein
MKLYRALDEGKSAAILQPSSFIPFERARSSAPPKAKAECPTERLTAPQHLLAMICCHLGIDHRATLIDFFGRHVHLLPEGETIRE